MFGRQQLSVLIEMLIKDASLRQIDEQYLRSLDYETVVRVSVKLTKDLKDAREQLRRNSKNSSMPPSRELPWAGVDSGDNDEDEDASEPEAPAPRKPANADGAGEEPEPAAEPAASAQESGDTQTTSAPPSGASNDNDGTREGASSPAPRKAGKQPGAQGYGRVQRLEVTGTEHHYVEKCALCEREAPPGGIGQTAWTGFYVLDLGLGEAGRAGLTVTHTLHRYYRYDCACGHQSETQPHRSADDELWSGVTVSQWRLIGPTLAAFIVALTYRGRMSRKQVQEFLHDWFGIALSVGCLQQCITEAARANDAVEPQLVADALDTELLHADETTHPERGQLLWLWVFANRTTVLYYIGLRNQEMVQHLLIEEGYVGWLMSDGYQVYRRCVRRLRCWAHLFRKAMGLQESLDRNAQAFGGYVDQQLRTLMRAVYAARGSPGGSLKEQYAEELEQLRRRCEQVQQSSHAKTRKLAVELLNDWDAIFAVLDYPHLPLTNNEAERLLRHWVIARRISQGTRSAVGSRAFALLASVIETCRRRAQSPWRYLAAVIEAARAGRAVPSLPRPANDHRALASAA